MRENSCIGLILMDGTQVLAKHPYSGVEPLQCSERINEEYVERVPPTYMGSFVSHDGRILMFEICNVEHNIAHPTEG